MEPLMKKPKLELEEQTPRKVIRADKAPTDGYSLVVDGHFKSHHATVEAAEEAGMALKNQFQMLQVQVYDAETKTPREALCGRPLRAKISKPTVASKRRL